MSAGLDLDFDDVQSAIADTVDQLCRDHCTDEAVKALEDEFPGELWSRLAELGVLGLATPEGDGGPVELIAAVEALGAAVFPGPIAATFLTTQLVDERMRAAVSCGEAIAAVGAPPLMPWGPHANVFIDAGEGNDVFIYLALDPGSLTDANWAKSGQVAALNRYLRIA